MIEVLDGEFDAGQSASVQLRRRLANVGTSFGTMRPDSVRSRGMLPGAGTFVGEADQIMLLEGGPSGLEDAVLGDLHGDLSAEMPMPQPISLGRRKAVLNKLLGSRRAALASARAQRGVIENRIDSLDRLLDNSLRPKFEAAEAAGNQAEIRRVSDEADKADLLRGVAASRGLRFAKLEALAMVMIKQTRTMLNLLALMEQAMKRGKTGAAKTFKETFNKLARLQTQLKNVRRKQIRKWAGQTSATRFAASNLLRRQGEAKLASMERQIMSSPPALARRLHMKASSLRQKIKKLRKTEREEAQRIGQATGKAPSFNKPFPQIPAGRTFGPEDQDDFESQSALAGLLGEVGDLGIGLPSFNSLTKFAKKAGGILTGGDIRKLVKGAKKKFKKLKKKYKNLIKRAAAVAKKLIKLGCKAANNSAVFNAAASAAGVPPPASETARKMVASACSGSSPSDKAAQTSLLLNAGQIRPAAEEKPKISTGTILIGGGAAAALLFLL